jgi:hypothetical protein
MTCGFCQRMRRLPRALIERIVAAQTKAKPFAVSLHHADGRPLTAGELRPGQTVRFDPATGLVEVENHHEQPDQREP